MLKKFWDKCKTKTNTYKHCDKTTAAQVTHNNKIVQFGEAAYLRAARLSWEKQSRSNVWSNDTKKVNIALIYGGRFQDSKLNLSILPFHIKRNDGWSESCSSLRVQGDKPCGAPRAEAETCLQIRSLQP